MKRLLVARPEGAQLFELSDEEFARLEHVLEIEEPRARGAWVRRFMNERVPAMTYAPGSTGPPDDVEIDRALGGNLFTPKWGRQRPKRSTER
jgi:hypothetical protein